MAEALIGTGWIFTVKEQGPGHYSFEYDSPEGLIAGVVRAATLEEAQGIILSMYPASTFANDEVSR